MAACSPASAPCGARRCRGCWPGTGLPRCVRRVLLRRASRRPSVPPAPRCRSAHTRPAPTGSAMAMANLRSCSAAAPEIRMNVSVVSAGTARQPTQRPTAPVLCRTPPTFSRKLGQRTPNVYPLSIHRPMSLHHTQGGRPLRHASTQRTCWWLTTWVSARHAG